MISKRAIRHSERTFNKLKLLPTFDDYCGICCETLLDSNNVYTIPVCGHIVYGLCWTRYITHETNKVCESVEDLTAVHICTIILLWEVGPKCPMCRMSRCTVDQFALHMADIDKKYRLLMRVKRHMITSKLHSAGAGEVVHV